MSEYKDFKIYSQKLNEMGICAKEASEAMIKMTKATKEYTDKVRDVKNNISNRKEMNMEANMNVKIILTLNEKEVNKRMKASKLETAEELNGSLKQEFTQFIKLYKDIWKDAEIVVEDNTPKVTFCCGGKLACQDFDDYKKSIQAEVYRAIFDSSVGKELYETRKERDALIAEKLELERKLTSSQNENGIRANAERINNAIITRLKNDKCKLENENERIKEKLKLAKDANKTIKEKGAELEKANKALSSKMEGVQNVLDALAHTVYGGDGEIIHCVMSERIPMPDLKDGKRYSTTEVAKMVCDAIAERDVQYKVALENFFEGLGYED